MQPTSQSQETGALPVIRAATDPTLTGQGFKYFGPFYKGPINANIGNEGKTLLFSYLYKACYTCALNESVHSCTTIKWCLQYSAANTRHISCDKPDASLVDVCWLTPILVHTDFGVFATFHA